MDMQKYIGARDKIDYDLRKKIAAMLPEASTAAQVDEAIAQADALKAELFSADVAPVQTTEPWSASEIGFE